MSADSRGSEYLTYGLEICLTPCANPYTHLEAPVSGKPNVSVRPDAMTISFQSTRGTFGMELIEQWKIQDALDIYEVRHWGKGYFGINDKGHVTVHPNKKPEQAVDLKELIDQLQERGIQLPILLRFTDILRQRVGEIYEAFKTAISEYNYQGNYVCVYPIKVNQQRHVVEEIPDFG